VVEIDMGPELIERNASLPPKYHMMIELPTLLICELCGSLVPAVGAPRHTEWHRVMVGALRNAVGLGSLFGGPRG
jgi:hypothetical protein